MVDPELERNAFKDAMIGIVAKLEQNSPEVNPADLAPTQPSNPAIVNTGTEQTVSPVGPDTQEMSLEELETSDSDYHVPEAHTKAALGQGYRTVRDYELDMANPSAEEIRAIMLRIDGEKPSGTRNVNFRDLRAIRSAAISLVHSVEPSPSTGPDTENSTQHRRGRLIALLGVTGAIGLVGFTVYSNESDKGSFRVPEGNRVHRQTPRLAHAPKPRTDADLSAAPKPKPESPPQRTDAYLGGESSSQATVKLGNKVLGRFVSKANKAEEAQEEKPRKGYAVKGSTTKGSTTNHAGGGPVAVRVVRKPGGAASVVSTGHKVTTQHSGHSTSTAKHASSAHKKHTVNHTATHAKKNNVKYRKPLHRCIPGAGDVGSNLLPGQIEYTSYGNETVELIGNYTHGTVVDLYPCYR